MNIVISSVSAAMVLQRGPPGSTPAPLGGGELGFKSFNGAIYASGSDDARARWRGRRAHGLM